MTKIDETAVPSCVFWKDVSCPFVKSSEFHVMDRCESCREYQRFNDDMEEEDLRVMEEVEEEHKRLDEERRKREALK